MSWKAPGKYPIYLLIAAVLLAASGSWKRYQDLNDLAELRESRTSAIEFASTADAAQKQLATEHRDSLLVISRKERALREMEGKSAPGLSLRRSIEMDVRWLLWKKQIPSFASELPGNVTAVEFESRLEHDDRQALKVDLALIGASILCMACGLWMWSVDLKRGRTLNRG